jgi:hypothetical protein
MLVVIASEMKMIKHCTHCDKNFHIEEDIGKSGFERPLAFVTFAVLRCICSLFAATAQVLSE